MRRAKLWRYAIPMESGVMLRDRQLRQREGLILRLQEGELCGWGEIAPLPGFSGETLAQAQQAALEQLTVWQTGQAPGECGVPSVDFAFSCAQAEMTGGLPPLETMSSALLCSGDPDALLLRLRDLPSRCVKMKVGLYEAARDALLTGMLLDLFPDLTLRLDANRSWTPLKAEQFARRLTPEQRQRIAFIEEPCRSVAESRRFAAASGIAIAWDESLRTPDFSLQAEPGVTAIVIKPTLTGSLALIRQQVAQAHRLGLEAVISSSLESSLGLTQLARLASLLTPDTLPGLDTLSLMRQQLLRRWPGCDLPLQEAERWTPLC